MPKIIAGLNMDLGLELESTIDLDSYDNLSAFIRRYFLNGSPEKTHSIHILGDLFGRPANQSYPPESSQRIKLNTAPVIGRVIIGNYSRGSLKLHEDISPDKIENQSAILNAQASGYLEIERVDVIEPYQDVLAAFDLTKVDIQTYLQTNGLIKLVTELNVAS